MELRENVMSMPKSGKTKYKIKCKRIIINGKKTEVKPPTMCKRCLCGQIFIKEKITYRNTCQAW